MMPIIKLLRPQQWSKNAFILLPLFFDKKFAVSHVLILTVVCALAFSFAASAVYCFNDIMDREADALHPVKRNRPLASGQVSVVAGWLVLAVCLVLSLSLTAAFLPGSVTWIVVAYLVINTLYSLWLKHVGLVDVLTVALFYVIRVVAGALSGDIALSHWIVIMTFLLALFLVLGKRRDDVMLQSNGGNVVRKGAAGYNVEFVNMALTMVATITIVAYVMYTISPEVMARFDNHYVYITTIFVLSGILRYLQLTVVGNRSGSPTKVLFCDHFIQACVVLWGVSFFIIIYCL